MKPCNSNTWTNKLNSFTQRMSKFYLLFYYCDSWKFNLISGFFISLFMVTGGKVIFICSPEAHLSESITSEILKLGGSFLFQNVQNFNVDSENDKKKSTKSFLFFRCIIAFQLVMANSLYYYKSARSWQSMC